MHSKTRSSSIISCILLLASVSNSAYARYALEDLELGIDFFAMLLFYAVGIPLLLGLGTYLILRVCYRTYSSSVILPLLLSCAVWWGSFFLKVQYDEINRQPAVLETPARPYVSQYEQRQALIASEPEGPLKEQLATMGDKEIQALIDRREDAKWQAELDAKIAANKKESVILGGVTVILSIVASIIGFYHERKPKA